MREWANCISISLKTAKESASVQVFGSKSRMFRRCTTERKLNQKTSLDRTRSFNHLWDRSTTSQTRMEIHSLRLGTKPTNASCSFMAGTAVMTNTSVWPKRCSNGSGTKDSKDISRRFDGTRVSPTACLTQESLIEVRIVPMCMQ